MKSVARNVEPPSCSEAQAGGGACVVENPPLT